MADYDDKYVCSLSEASLKKAKAELGEDPKNRLGAVQTLRKWLMDQKHLKCPMDTGFLLSILRARKFSQLASRELIENYLRRRQKYRVWFQNCNALEPNQQAVLSSGLFIFLPGVNDDGQKVVMVRTGALANLDSSIDKNDIIRTFTGIIDHLLSQEELQVNGLIQLLDFSHTTMKMHGRLPIEDRKNFIQSFQRHFPVRTKGVHIYNAGVFVDIILGLVKMAMTEKIQKRVVNHGSNLESLYDYIPYRLLPEEYLPDDYTGPNSGSVDDIVAQMMKAMNDPETVALVRERSALKYGISEDRPKESTPVASFRKLAVD